MNHEVTAAAATQGRDDDIILPFRFENVDLRGRLARLGPSLDKILTAHDYPDAVATLLGEALTLATVIAGTFKFEGRFTLQTSSQGPVGLMIADFTTDGALRGYARFDADAVTAAEAEAAISGPVPRLLGSGHLAFTVDQGADTETYQGVVGLEGATLADCAHEYLRQSEQLAAAVRLEVGRIDGDWRAGALMLERLAGAPADGRGEDEAEDDRRRALVLLGSAQPDEFLDADLSGGALLYRLFHEDGVRVYQPASLEARCNCSRERMISVLATFSAEELTDMVVDGVVTSTCQFCNAEHAFSQEDIEARRSPG